MNWILLLEQTLNGLQLGILLFLLAAGLTLIFGIMDLINLAHGSLYMMGAYFAATFTNWTCLLYTSDAADERSSVDLGGRRIIKKKDKAEGCQDLIKMTA